MLYFHKKQATTKKRDCHTGTERMFHRLEEHLSRVSVLTTSELRLEIRGDGPSRYRGYERQPVGCKQGGTVEYMIIVSHP